MEGLGLALKVCRVKEQCGHVDVNGRLASLSKSASAHSSALRNDSRLAPFDPWRRLDHLDLVLPTDRLKVGDWVGVSRGFWGMWEVRLVQAHSGAVLKEDKRHWRLLDHICVTHGIVKHLSAHPPPVQGSRHVASPGSRALPHTGQRGSRVDGVVGSGGG